MSSVLYEVNSYIAHVTLNRENSLNAINHSMLQRLQEVILDIRNNHQVRVVIISGSGDKAFSVGADVKERNVFSDSAALEQSTRFNEILRMLEQLPQPTIAAMNGYAFGAGLELALACDFRIAVNHTLIGFPETSYGTIPSGGGTQRLPRLIGEARALEMILTGRRISTVEACQFGLILYSVPKSQLDETAIDLANRIICNAPLAVQKAKLAIKSGLQSDFHSGLSLEHKCYEMILPTRDRKEALSAFMHKRKPVYYGY
ncbi:enoyl-CoA hydratase-related protein [Peribacillus acanthi]|uniref:enoyl-CoA hydratase-related protein n=1 Tax=Peribacillus acanthi TaxID=2171554 RepID=UPI000D3EC2D0|nr:enoyl-CoA hydratase-related protein [Peribacillus acanthi]